MMKWRYRVCPLCGSTDDSTVLAESNFDEQMLDRFSFSSRKSPEYMHFRMLLCPKCDLCYASPVPELSWVCDEYEHAHFNASSESYCAAKTYADYLSTFLDSLPGLEGALDIGTGDGAFLEQLLKIGFSQVEGVEPSHAALSVTKPHVASLIREGFFDPAMYTKESMSLISCHQTIEHVDNPLELFASVYDLLRPGGCLFIVAHNRLAISARLMGIHSPVFDIEHLQLLSQKTTREFFQRTGFQRVHLSPIRNRYPLSYWLKLMPLRVDIKKKMVTLVQTIGLAKIVLSIHAGNLAAVGFKPFSKGTR